jgi:hypothetical protein
MRHRRIGRLLFQGDNGAGVRDVKVFENKYATSEGCRKIFFKTACGLTLTAR